MSRCDYSVNAMIAEEWYRDQMHDREREFQKIEAENGHCMSCERYNANCSACSRIKRQKEKMDAIRKSKRHSRCPKCTSSRTHIIIYGTRLKCLECGYIAKKKRKT